MQLRAKIFMTGKIELLTGLHIGGSKSALDIGGVDNPVIKLANGQPYIPGSSIKGKIRCLLEREAGKEEVCRCGTCNICKIFGTAASEGGSLTRLYVRDARLNEEYFEEKKEELFPELELDYTEVKWENLIDRIRSKAQHPRQTERVPARAQFNFEFVFTVYENDDEELLKDIIKGMRLLEDDYLGGSGSRGYGKIKFKDIEIKSKTITEYEGDNKAKLIGNFKTLDEIEPDKFLSQLKEALC